MKRIHFAVVLLALFTACGSKKSGAANDGSSRDAGTTLDASVDAAQSLVDAGSQSADASAGFCPAENLVSEGCEDLKGKTEAAAGRCDGYDNDCNGTIDDDCPCTPGSVQECFAGPPGRAKTGACRRGTQVCLDSVEFSGWSSCDRSVVPSTEVCDRLDNDCNGCTDELDGCEVFIDCPGPDDARVPPAKPFESYVLDAGSFYNGNDVASYAWKIDGSPCDKLFQEIPQSRATDTNGRLSFTLSGANQKQASVRFTLSGTYLVTLDITLKNGKKLGCSFPLSVSGPGLRVELCWDKTGPTSLNPVDLDLHLALKGTTPFFRSGADCYYETCVPKSPGNLSEQGIWGHPNNPDVSSCLAGRGLDEVYKLRGSCINPRADIDNQDERSAFVPENINLDYPRAGEVFQVAVNHKSPDAVRTRTLVNVYCGGKLKGSYSLDPKKTAFSDTMSEDELWRVVEIAPIVDDSGLTTDCTLKPLHPQDAPQEPLITDGNFGIKWSD